MKCVSWDGTTEGAEVWVAKPPELRADWVASWTERIEDADVTYTWSERAANCDGQRTTHIADGSTDQVEIVTPIYHINATYAEGTDPDWSEIWADTPAGGTGVEGDDASGGLASGTPVTLMDQNRAGRAWTQVA
jgi:hypothetical protein